MVCQWTFNRLSKERKKPWFAASANFFGYSHHGWRLKSNYWPDHTEMDLVRDGDHWFLGAGSNSPLAAYNFIFCRLVGFQVGEHSNKEEGRLCWCSSVLYEGKRSFRIDSFPISSFPFLRNILNSFPFFITAEITQKLKRATPWKELKTDPYRKDNKHTSS